MAYCTVAELRAQLGIDDSVDDDTLSLAVDTASQHVDNWCGRSFDVPSGVTVVSLPADHPRVLRLPFDLADTTSLVVETDDNADGTFETTWTIGTDFIVGPTSRNWNGDTIPYATLTAVDGKVWPYGTARHAVRVTGRLGWLAVPSPVKFATLLLAKDLWKTKDTFGGVAGFGDLGALRIRQDPTIAMLLAKYRTGYGGVLIA